MGNPGLYPACVPTQVAGVSLPKGLKRDILRQNNSRLVLGVASSGVLGLRHTPVLQIKRGDKDGIQSLFPNSVCPGPHRASQSFMKSTHAQGLSWHHVSFSNKFYFPIFPLPGISIFIQPLSWMDKVLSMCYLGCLHSFSCTVEGSV